MRRLARAYTLIELIVVLAIVSILAAILFPVLAGVRASAQGAVCISNMKQITASINLYANDYDDYFMLTRQQSPELANSRNDRTWVQLVLPYVRSFNVFRCPADTSERPKAEATFDQDLVPGDTDSRYYTASMRTNYGLNYQYLSPIFISSHGWMPQPRSMTRVERPSATLLLMDSVWSRNEGGQPTGGGSWLVTPPCRFHEARGRRLDSFREYALTDGQVFTVSEGWSVESQESPEVYGNAWPWHRGRINTATVDGSVRTMRPASLSAGCNLEQYWQGTIVDSSSYLWDLR